MNPMPTQRSRNGPPRTAPRPRVKHPPLVGISCDMDAQRAFVSRNYIAAVSAAGASPILLGPVPGPGPAVAETAAHHAALCDAFILTGGDDPATEDYGTPTHPKAVRVHPDRQRFEEQLLAILASDHPDKPVLGVCLGMQLMALAAGGTLNQHLPDDTTTAADHADGKAHDVAPTVDGAIITAGKVTSRHHQAVREPGDLRVIAVAHDGVVEALDDPDRRFYLGVQWHPERTPLDALGPALIRATIDATKPRRARK